MKKLSKKKKKTLIELIALVSILLIYFYMSNNGKIENPIIDDNGHVIQFPGSSDSNGTVSIDDIPAYSGKRSVVINGNVPFFTSDEMKEAREQKYFEVYGDLDALGRCTVAYDCLGRETMPQDGEKRGDISAVHPSGWHQRKYNCVYDYTLMTRTHLAGWMLSAENANERNLISGTRYMNSDAMIEYERRAQYYIYNHPGKHVLYRVTPIYSGNELVARGVLMEAKSVEDNGASLQYCVYCYNIQPGIDLNYTNGWSDYTGIFFDIDAESVVTRNINLYDFKMDMESRTIHIPSCSECVNAVPFLGDISMVVKWPGLGYTNCSCIYAENYQNAA